MKKTALTFILLCVCAAFCFAQDVLQGRVVDIDNKVPLVGATVKVTGTGKGTITGQKGDFTLTDLAPDSELEVTYLGYERMVVRVTRLDQRLNIALRTDAAMLSEVMVTGFENQRKLTQVAGGIAVLKPQEIQRYSNADLQLTFNAIPGVRMEATAPGGSTRLSIRGSLLRSPFGIRGVKAYWNDLPLTDAGGSTPYDIFEPGILGSMEVLKGPSGSIYGAGTGGVVLFNSSLPAAGETSVEAGYSGGSFGLSRYSLTARTGTQNARLQAGYVDQAYGGYRPNNGTYRRLFNLTGQISTGNRGLLSLYAYHVRRNFDLPGALTLEEFQANPRQSLPFAIANRTRLTSESSNIGLSYQYDLANNLTASVAAYVSHSSTPQHPYGSAQAFAGYFVGSTVGTGGRTKLTWSPKIGSVQSRFTAGAEYQYDNQRSTDFRLNNGQPVPGEVIQDVRIATRQNIFFTQAEFDLPYGFITTLGASYNNLQYDVFDFRNSGAANGTGLLRVEPAFAPRISLVKKITASLSAHASVGRGFSPPGRNEINVSGRINPNLLPEDGTNYEVGIRGGLLNGALQVDLTAYQLRLRNIILQRTLLSGLSEFENGGAANNSGIEAMVGYIFFRNENTFFRPSKLWVNYTYQDYRFGNFVIRNDQTGAANSFLGNQLPGVSPHVAVSGFDLNTKTGLYGNVTFFYFADRFVNNANTVSDQGYTLLNTKLGYRRRWGKAFETDVYAGGENLQNTVYVGTLGLNGTRVYSLGQPRAFFGGVALKYNF